jgi:uncharacterized protein YecT (DUF1311 family)
MLSAFAALALLALAQPAAVPPPIEQTSADCARPTYASDMLVCGDSELKARDAELAVLVAKTPIAGTAVMESDAAWFKRRSRCAFSADHRACLAAAYAERLALRAALVGAPSPDEKPALCSAGNGGIGTRYSPAPGNTLVLRDASTGEALGVLFQNEPEDAPWKPFAAYSLLVKRMSIRTTDGTFWRCRW